MRSSKSFGQMQAYFWATLDTLSICSVKDQFLAKKIVFINFSVTFHYRRPVFRPWSGQFWSKSKNKKSILFVSMRPIRSAIYVLRKSGMRARHFARRLQFFQNPDFYKNGRHGANKFFKNIPGPLLFLYFILEKYKNIKKIFFFSNLSLN